MNFKPEKKLGFGLMRLPVIDRSNAADVDIEQVKQMVDRFMEKGFTYFDTAWMYQGFASEKVAKEALVDRYPRESFTLATKLHAGFFDSLEDRVRYSMPSLKRQGPDILTIICSMALKRICFPSMRSWIVFSGCWIRKRRGW